jgi:archaemetzincin
MHSHALGNKRLQDFERQPDDCSAITFSRLQKMSPKHESCQHRVLCLDPSAFAPLAGYTQPTKQQRMAAVTTFGRAAKASSTESSQTFPAPLVLPHDELNYDPDCEPQSVNDWLQAEMRNKMKPELGRDTLYIGRVPRIGEDVSFMRDWTALANGALEQEASPDADLFVDYLRAFYHGMNVETIQDPLTWTAWEKKTQPRRQASFPKYVALSYGDQRTRIRVRKAPDGVFAAQLNLDDIIDATMAMLPTNAYALLLLVDHDIHEDEDDDFCCGRAYGGSRVAVVQTARYNPALDMREKIDRTHMWPFSHCKTFVDDLCAAEDVEALPPTKQQILASKDGPVRAAIVAAMESATIMDPAQERLALWFSRVARTVSHEIGHCFGIAHCVYYACNMQGTGGVKEDVRQPPYLCPICESKVAHAIVGELQSGTTEDRKIWIRARCEALGAFCLGLQDNHMETTMWRGLGAWSAARLKAAKSL